MLAGCTALAHHGLHVDAAVSPSSPTYYCSTPSSPTYYRSSLQLFQHAHHLSVLDQQERGSSASQNAFSMEMSVGFPQKDEKEDSVEKINSRREFFVTPKLGSFASAEVPAAFLQLPSKTSNTGRYNAPLLTSEACAMQPQVAIQNTGQGPLPNTSMLRSVNAQPSLDSCLLDEIQGIGRAVEGFGDFLWSEPNFAEEDSRGKISELLSQLRQDVEGNIYWDNEAQNSPCSCTRQEENVPWPQAMGSNAFDFHEAAILDGVANGAGPLPIQESGSVAAASTPQTSMSSAQLLLTSNAGGATVVTRSCCSPSSSSAAMLRSTGDSSPSSPVPWPLRQDSPSPAPDKKMMQQRLHQQLVAHEPRSVLDLAISPPLPPRTSHFQSGSSLEDFFSAGLVPKGRNLWFGESGKQFSTLPASAASLLPMPLLPSTSSLPVCHAGSEELEPILPLATEDLACLPSYRKSEHVFKPTQAFFGGESSGSDRKLEGTRVEKIGHRDTAPVDDGVELINLLVACVEAISAGSLTFINQLLAQLGRLASPSGSAVHRLAAYFTEGLACRVAKQWPQVYQPPPVEMDSNDEEESAWQVLNHATPLVKFAHYTANDIILEAFEGEERVHVIDLDIKQGLQWPALFQSLATRASGAPKHVRVTGVGECREDVQDAGDRLTEFAEEFGLSFQFHAVVDKIEDVRLWMLHVKEKEAVAVNSVLQLHRTLYDTTTLPGGAVRNLLSLIHSTRPKVVALVEQEADCHDQLSLEARFVAALRHFAALFDALDASLLPPISPARLKADALFARYIRNILACDGPLRLERYQPLSRWHHLLAPAGFRCLPLSQRARQQAHILLRMFDPPCPSSSGYRLLPDATRSQQQVPQSEESNEQLSFLTLAWSEEPLFTASAWAPA